MQHQNQPQSGLSISDNIPKYWHLTLLLGAMAITLWLYWPGLSGGFILDDYGSLFGLANIHAESFTDDLLLYLYSGNAGSLKRPISLLSFAVQYADWPLNPRPFKVVNLLIHLLNGILVMLLLQRLSNTHIKSAKQAFFISAIAASLWLTHPLQVSTVHYVVQRMTELSALFTLFGLWLYLVGRSQFYAGQTWKGLTWMSIGVGGGLIFSVLSKENGILISLYALVIEVTLFSAQPTSRLYRYWKYLFLYIPLIALIAYLSWIFQKKLLNFYAVRDFTLGERLLTEPRILFDYLGKMLIPSPSRMGLYFDDYIKSTSLLTPWTTLPSLLGVAGLLISSWWYRKAHPMAAFAVFWFFAGHSLEASIIPLELYFEHRNYLPIMGPLLVLVHYLLRGWHYIDSTLIRRSYAFVVSLILILYPTITHLESTLWGDPQKMAMIWAEENPDSKRAQASAGTYYHLHGKRRTAIKYFRRIYDRHPENSGAGIRWLAITCGAPDLPSPPRNELLLRAREGARDDLLGYSLLQYLVDIDYPKSCSNVPIERFLELGHALANNPKFIQLRADILLTLGELYARQGRYVEAIQTAKNALSLTNSPRLFSLLTQWSYLIQEHHQASHYLAKYKEQLENNPFRKLVWQKQYEQLAAIIESSQFTESKDTAP